MRLVTIITAILIGSGSLAIAQTTEPALASAALELRATQTFNSGKYDQALPMLQKLVSQLKPDESQADKVAMIQEQIRVCQKNHDLKPVISAKSAAAAAAEPVRTVHPAPKTGEVLELKITELGNFSFDPDKDSPIPADVKALDGCTVRLAGYMVPLDAAEKITRFALVPSLASCTCQLGGPPQIQHTIIVTCPKGKAVSYYQDQIVVEGKLTVGVVKDLGFTTGIFAMETSSVKPADP